MPVLTPEQLRSDTHAALAHARELRQSFLDLPADSSLGEVVTALDRIMRPFEHEATNLGPLTSLHPNQAVRDEAEALEQVVAEFMTEISLDREMYSRLADLSPDANADPQELRMLNHALRDYRRSGVDRSHDERARIKRLKEELVEIGQRFDRNILEGGATMKISEGHAALGGLPADYLAAHPEAEDGSVTLTTDPPSFMPFMLYAERDDLRQAFHKIYSNRAWPINGGVLDELLAKRHELATLLGFDCWASYATGDKMTKDTATARSFIERVSGLARARADAEYAELLEEKRKSAPDATCVFEWERSYLVEKVKDSKYGFDSQTVRPYFPYAKVKQGILDISSKLYGVEFRACPDADVWHADVECYEILEEGEPIARFYLDMFPRDGKFKHAAMFDLAGGLEGECLPEAALGCNFPRPTEDDPALMLHTQVTTYFHEVGHLLHHLLGGKARFLAFSGITTEWDFVEVPSQMFEEWAWNPEVLRSFALHHESGDPIPYDLIAKLRQAEEYGKGLQVSIQMFFAMLSLSVYAGDPAGLDTTEHMIGLRESMTPTLHVPDTHFQASFGHLHGYSAIYYTYMWSLVISKDLFSCFGDDPMNHEVASRYRERVLAPGGSRDAADLVEDFLGRPYNTEAWEAWLAS